MDIREATPEDRQTVAEIAERSLEASYSLSPSTIKNAVAKWYDEEAFEVKVDRDDLVVLVAEKEGEVVGFTESSIIDHDEHTTGDLLWLHVHPDHRGEGIGTELFETTRDRIREYGVTRMRGRVLSINEAGNTFYKEQGFEKIGEDEIEIDDRVHTEALYVEAEASGLQPISVDGETVYVDHDNVERGSVAGFHVIYMDENREEKYGYYCGKCEKPANAMDAMGRIECDTCGNSRKPSRWDAAYM
jgi:ribosomal protein S18 acetylase RimI-like enzyme